MNNTLSKPSDIRISKYNYSASMIISLITAIVLMLTNISYINIILFTILIFCVSLFYLTRNKLIEGGEFDAIVTTNDTATNKILDGIGTVLANNGYDVSTIITPAYMAELKSIVSSMTTTDVNNSSTSGIHAPYIDTTSKAKNDKLFDAYHKINLIVSCGNFNHTDCDAADSCIWVNNTSNTGVNSLCERGDKSGPYPLRNPNGSLVDVDYNYYKIK